ncbi:Hypothetical protein, putative [Bodo saltans]|uniref:PARP catalytic domain-containing protein n=1 Tax=Bodo saltans TaxID=75058 RepID=A0A0S4IXH6_BODSA|nr:Hypothetical protein, putative [Bodo saltans]|eukprot:CUG40099.1 Hypothetical protein, putative [Bodo saltans]
MLDAEPTDFIKRATQTRNEKKEAERVRKLTGEPTQPELPNEEKLRIAHKKQRRDCYAAVRLRFIEQDDLTSDSRCLNVTTLLYTALWACRFQPKEPTEALVKLTTLLSSAVDECGAILLISVLPDAQLIPLREYICDILEPHLSDSSGGDDSNELLSFRSAGDPLKEAAIDCLLNGVFALIAAAQLEASCAKRRSRNDRMNDNRKPAHTVRVHAPPNDKFVQQIEEMVHGMLGANRDAFVRNPCFCATACSAWQRFITGAMHVCGLNAGETMDDDSERWLLQNTQVVFHGTKSNDAIQRISCRGFDLGRRGKTNGQVHGVGEYFGRTIEMSDAYSGQTEVMLVCLALKETNALCPLPDRPLGFTPTIFVPSNEEGREMLVIDNKLEETFVAPIGILYHKALNRVARDTGTFDCDYPLDDLRAVEQIQDLSAQFADHLKTAVACQDLQRLRQFRRTIVLRFRLAVQKAASSAFPTGLPAMSFTHSSIWTSLSELNVEYRFCASTSAVADPSEVEQLQWFLCTATHNNEMGDEGPPSQQRVVLYKSKDSRCPMCAAAAEVKN